MMTGVLDVKSASKEVGCHEATREYEGGKAWRFQGGFMFARHQ